VLPDGWKVLHLNQTLRQLTNGFVGPTRDILFDEGVKYVQSLHIKNGVIDFERRPFYVANGWHDERPRVHLRHEDVLIVQTGDIGQVAVVPADFGEASCHALQIARVRPEIVSGSYLGEYLRTPFAYQSLLKRATGALHPHLEGGIRDVPVVVPPRSVQDALVDEARSMRNEAERLRECLGHQINLIAEHRQALISAAVTGELDLPGYSA
jgi:type I restriction enzyme S subunit